MSVDAPARRRSGFGRVLIVVGVVAVLVQAALVGGRKWREHIPVLAAGQRADRTVTTPVFLAVVDPEATARAREKELHRLPPLFRFDSRAGDRSVERFLTDYEQRHSLFQQGLQREWVAPLTSDDLASPQFADYLTAFRLAHAGFPLADEMAARWASEPDARPGQNQTATAIREAQRQYIVADELPAEAAGHAEILLSPTVETGGVTVPGRAEQAASRLQRRALTPVSKARSQLQQGLEFLGSDWASYAAGFSEVNVTFDAPFTRAAREEYAQRLKVEVAFKPGDPVIRLAHPVSVVQASALEELRQHFAREAQSRGWTQWWLGGFGLLLVLTGSLMPRTGARESAGELILTPTPASAAQLAAVRQGVIQQLSQWLKLQFIQRLIHQRNEAVTAQAQVSNQVEGLNDRLNKLHPEIRERVADYERRIAQLERELSTANEMSRELIKTKISLARKELEIEKARSNLVWN